MQQRFFRQVPESPGVYLMRGAADVALYAGKVKTYLPYRRLPAGRACATPIVEIEPRVSCRRRLRVGNPRYGRLEALRYVKSRPTIAGCTDLKAVAALRVPTQSIRARQIQAYGCWGVTTR